MIPKTYFSTPLSKSAKDTEGRIRNIFEGQRRRPAVIVLTLVAAVALLCGSVVALRAREATEKNQMRDEAADSGNGLRRFSGDGWYMDVPTMLGTGEDAVPLSHEIRNMDGDYAGELFYVFHAGEDAALTVMHDTRRNTSIIFDPEISIYDDAFTLDPERSVISSLDLDGSLSESYYVDAPDGGCYEIMLSGAKHRDELWAMAKSFTLDQSASAKVEGSETLRGLLADLLPEDLRLSFYEGKKLRGSVDGASALLAADYLASLVNTEWVDARPMDEDDRADTWHVVLDAPGFRLTSYQSWGTVLVETENESLWLDARYVRDDGPDTGYGDIWLLEGWYLDAAAAEAHRRPQIEAFPKNRPLTGEELRTWREELATIRENRQTVVSCFFTSYYSDPRDLDLFEFLYYCPLGESASDDYGTVVDEGERAALLATGKYPGDFVPTHRYRVSAVNAALAQYAGITLDDLRSDWRNDARILYLPQYDAFYNFSSDFSPGMFYPRYGEIRNNVVTLWSDTAMVELVTTGDGWQIQSHMAIAD